MSNNFKLRMKRIAAQQAPSPSPRLSQAQSVPAIRRADDFLHKYVPAYAQSARTARVDFRDYFSQTER